MSLPIYRCITRNGNPCPFCGEGRCDTWSCPEALGVGAGERPRKPEVCVPLMVTGESTPLPSPRSIIALLLGRR